MGFLTRAVVLSNNRHQSLEAKHLKNKDLTKFRYHQRIRHAQDLRNEVLPMKERKKIFQQVKKTNNDDIPF